MQISWFNLSMAVWLLLCLVDPLHSDPRRSYWPGYNVYDQLDRPIYSVNTVQRPVRYVEPIVSKSLDYNVRYNYPTSDYVGPWIPTRYAYPEESREVKSAPENVARGTYYDHRVVHDNEDRGSSKDSRESAQQLDDQYVGGNWRDEEIVRKMDILEKLLAEDTGEKVLDTNTIEDKIISETNIPEETKRVVRQVRKQRPGFFWTLARVTFETINDTRSAIQQISDIINANVAPDSATQSSATISSLKVPGNGTATADSQNNVSNNLSDVNATSAQTVTTMRPTTTTQAFVLTRSGLQSLIRRNVAGLVRLFNIEWRDALNQSETSVREFQTDLGRQVGSYLRDNPANY